MVKVRYFSSGGDAVFAARHFWASGAYVDIAVEVFERAGIDFYDSTVEPVGEGGDVEFRPYRG